MRLNFRTAATIYLVSALCLPLSAHGQGDPSTSSSDTPSSFNITDPAQASDPIAKLELRIFDHTYKADSQDARLKRLENFVFGAAQTGDTNTRLSKLQESVTSTAAASPSPAGQGEKAAEAAPPPKTFDEADYPRVDQLEQQILGQQHSHEILSGRLARLEAKAFGKPSSSTDPADRVDALDAYVARHDIYGGQGNQNIGQTTPFTPSYAQSAPATSGSYGFPSTANSYAGSYGSAPPASNYAGSYGSTPAASSYSSAYPGTRPGGSTSSYQGTPPQSASSSPSYSSPSSTPYSSPYPTGTNDPYGQGSTQSSSNPYLQANVTSTNDRLASMERTEFGRDYPTHSLKDRVQRLEKKVDPNKKGHEGQSLPARVDQLWAVVSVSNSIGSAPIASSAAHGNDSYSSSNGNYNQQSGYNNNGNKSHHSLLHSVGKVLGAAAVTGGSAAMMMGGMGMGGMGGYGMSRYGMGGYGMSPFSNYGSYGGYGNYGSYGGYGGYGSGYGGYGNYGLGRF